MLSSIELSFLILIKEKSESHVYVLEAGPHAWFRRQRGGACRSVSV